MHAYAITDIGKIREINEDSFICQPPFFVVADGMGGHLAGEVASRLAAETTINYLNAHAGQQHGAMLLQQAIVEANTAVYRLAQENPQFSGMGTTVTAVQVVGSDIVWGHVGDSRLYLLHENHLSQLTEDHSLVRELIRSGTISADEASSHPQRNVLIRAIGNTETVRVDTGVTPWSTGDQLILCSDGLTNLVKNHEILQVLTAANVPGEMRLANLIALANERGGLDNITAILVQREDSK